MALLGADTDELREVGKEFEEGKEITDDVIKFIQALIIALKAASFFSGGASAAYAEYLETEVLPWLQKISQALGAFAQVLNAQAQQQDDTSSASTVPSTTASTSAVPSYTGATNLPPALQPFNGGSIVGGTTSGGTSAPAASGSAPAASATPTTTTAATSTPGGAALSKSPTTAASNPLQELTQLATLANTLSHLGDPSATTAAATPAATTTSTTPVTTTPTIGTTPDTSSLTGTTGTTAPTGTDTSGLTATTQPHFTVDPTNGHLMIDTGIDTNGPDATTTGTTAATTATGLTPTSATTSPLGMAPGTLGTHSLGTALPGHTGPITSHMHSPANPNLGGHAGHTGSHSGGSTPSGTGSSSSPASSTSPLGHHGIDAGSHLTPMSHAQALSSSSDAGTQMSTGSSATPAMSHSPQAMPVAANHPSYGAAAGIAGGAAVLGLGGAAVAARSSNGTGGSNPAIDDLAAGNGRGSKGEEVKELQQKLTAAGYDTQGADGVWGKNTEAAYEAYRSDHPLAVQSGQGYTAPDGYDYTKITGVSGNANVTPEFLRGVEAMSQRLGAKPEHVLAAMSFETGGTFSPGVRNPHSSATGLIQFMDSTAKGLGTTTHDLSQMTPTQQLPYVEKYFEPYRGKLGDLDSVYSTILAGHPASGDTALFTQGSHASGAAYTANAPLDADHDGVITADEAAAKVSARMGK